MTPSDICGEICMTVAMKVSRRGGRREINYINTQMTSIHVWGVTKHTSLDMSILLNYRDIELIFNTTKW